MENIQRHVHVQPCMQGILSPTGAWTAASSDSNPSIEVQLFYFDDKPHKTIKLMENCPILSMVYLTKWHFLFVFAFSGNVWLRNVGDRYNDARTRWRRTVGDVIHARVQRRRGWYVHKHSAERRWRGMYECVAAVVVIEHVIQVLMTVLEKQMYANCRLSIKAHFYSSQIDISELMCILS